jgi:hypothetical protein
VLGAAVAGCSQLIGSMAADTLSAAILNESDPRLVTNGVPAYLLLVDGFIAQDPDDEDLLAAGAQLFALYGSRFESDPAQAAALTEKARTYGQRALCRAYPPACDWDGLDYADFVTQLNGVERKNIDYLYAYAVGWLANLEATSEDWTAVAELPWVEAALERALMLDETYENGALHAYLGILNSLRPPAYGGRPDVAKAHFERAIELSGGRDLSIKVEYARRYARLVFDKELHDRLLEEVLAAPVEAPGLTLFNTLAKQEARELLASSGDYF